MLDQNNPTRYFKRPTGYWWRQLENAYAKPAWKNSFFFLGVINITEWKSSEQRMIDHIERILHIKNKKKSIFFTCWARENLRVCWIFWQEILFQWIIMTSTYRGENGNKRSVSIATENKKKKHFYFCKIEKTKQNWEIKYMLTVWKRLKIIWK